MERRASSPGHDAAVSPGRGVDARRSIASQSI